VKWEKRRWRRQRGLGRIRTGEWGREVGEGQRGECKEFMGMNGSTSGMKV
jgi:hypothetical protein